MWSEEKFEDKLIMMRDALVEFEIERQNIKMRATQPKPAESSAADDLRRSVSVNDEIFELQRKAADAGEVDLDDMLLNNDTEPDLSEVHVVKRL